jgi:hypothetical protein
MSPEQIIEHVKLAVLDGPSQRAFACNFMPHPDADAAERIAVTYGRTMVGRQIRNTYGLWEKGNPYVDLDAAPNAEGIVDDPKFPDNLSGKIVEAVCEYFHGVHPGVTHCDRLIFDEEG